eukprot:gene31-322_t
MNDFQPEKLKLFCMNVGGASISCPSVVDVLELCRAEGKDVVFLSECNYLRSQWQAEAKAIALEKGNNKQLRVPGEGAGEAPPQGDKNDSEDSSEALSDSARSASLLGQNNGPRKRGLESGHVDHDGEVCIFSNGTAVVLRNNTLVHEFRRRQKEKLTTIKFNHRFITVFLDSIILQCCYGPVTNRKKCELDCFDASFEEQMEGIRRDRGERWKPIVAAGDYNVVLNQPGSRPLIRTHVRGRKFILPLRRMNIVPAREERPEQATHKSEVLDYFLIKGGSLDEQAGEVKKRPILKSKLPGNYKFWDHLAIEMDFSILRKQKAYLNSRKPKKARVELPDPGDLDPEVAKAFNRRLASEGADLNDFQRIFSEEIPNLQTPVKKSGSEGVGGGLPDVGARHCTSIRGCWEELNRGYAGTKVSGITSEQAKTQYQKTSTTPLPHVDLSILDDVQKFAELQLQNFDRPISRAEYNKALKALNPRGAKDRSGCLMVMLGYLDDQQTDKLVNFLEDARRSGSVGAWGAELRSAKCSWLYKNKGPINEALYYRFLSVVNIFSKIYMKILCQRIKVVNGSNCNVANSDVHLGFKSGVGCREAVLIDSRLREDCRLCDTPAFMQAHRIMLDIAKAFPAADSRFIAAVGSKTGLDKTQAWKAALDAHRQSIFHFAQRGEDDSPENTMFGRPNGLREGCVSSPEIFLLIFTILTHAIQKKRETDPEVRNHGVLMVSGGHHAPVDHVEKTKALLWPRDVSDITQRRAGRMHFADGTSLYVNIRQWEAEFLQMQVERNEGLAEADRLPIGAMVSEAFCDHAESVGTKINLSKTEVGNILTMDSKLLGYRTQETADILYKIGRSWGTFTGFKKRLVLKKKMEKPQKGHLFTGSVRGGLCYCLESRAVGESQLSMVQCTENGVLRDLEATNPQKMHATGFTQADIRWRYCVNKIRDWVLLQKASFYGHCMRRDDNHIVKQVICGRFFVETEQVEERRCYFTKGKNAITTPQKEIEQNTVLGDVIRYLNRECRIPVKAIPHLLSPEPEHADRRALYQRLTRDQFVRMWLADVQKCKKLGNPEEKEAKIVEFKLKLCKKYQVEEALD